MVHVSQKIRMQNLQTVKKLIAQTMPKGALDNKLVAILCTTYGFHRKTAREYLRDLSDSNQILWVPTESVWKLPTEKKEKEEN